MGLTKKTDVFVPELFVEAVKGAFSGMKLLYGTGAAVVNAMAPFGKPEVGDTVKVPYFSTLGEAQDVAADGDALTPQAISMSTESATVNHSGFAFEVTKWAQLSASEDPYAELARQALLVVDRRADKALIDVAKSTTSWSALTKDVYSAGTPRTLDIDLVVDGRALWGDETQDIACLCIHSKVEADLRKAKDSTGRPLYVDAIAGEPLGRFGGYPVLVSDRLTASSGKYTSMLIKKGALAFWINGKPTFKTEDDILADSQIAACHFYWLAHRYTRLSGLTKGGVVLLQHN